MKRYYFKTKSKGKCNCSFERWHYTDKYSSKAELKRSVYMRVVEVLTEEQLIANWGQFNADKIMATAMHW